MVGHFFAIKLSQESFGAFADVPLSFFAGKLLSITGRNLLAVLRLRSGAIVGITYTAVTAQDLVGISEKSQDIIQLPLQVFRFELPISPSLESEISSFIKYTDELVIYTTKLYTGVLNSLIQINEGEILPQNVSVSPDLAAVPGPSTSSAFTSQSQLGPSQKIIIQQRTSITTAVCALRIVHQCLLLSFLLYIPDANKTPAPLLYKSGILPFDKKHKKSVKSKAKKMAKTERSGEPSKKFKNPHYKVSKKEKTGESSHLHLGQSSRPLLTIIEFMETEQESAQVGEPELLNSNVQIPPVVDVEEMETENHQSGMSPVIVVETNVCDAEEKEIDSSKTEDSTTDKNRVEPIAVSTEGAEGSRPQAKCPRISVKQNLFPSQSDNSHEYVPNSVVIPLHDKDYYSESNFFRNIKYSRFVRDNTSPPSVQDNTFQPFVRDSTKGIPLPTHYEVINDLPTSRQSTDATGATGGYSLVVGDVTPAGRKYFHVAVVPLKLTTFNHETVLLVPEALAIPEELSIQQTTRARRHPSYLPVSSLQMAPADMERGCSHLEVALSPLSKQPSTSTRTNIPMAGTSASGSEVREGTALSSAKFYAAWSVGPQGSAFASSGSFAKDSAQSSGRSPGFPTAMPSYQGEPITPTPLSSPRSCSPTPDNISALRPEPRDPKEIKSYRMAEMFGFDYSTKCFLCSIVVFTRVPIRSPSVCDRCRKRWQ